MGDDELEVIQIQATPLSNREYTPEEKIVLEQYSKNQMASILAAGVAGASFILGIVGLIARDARFTMACITFVLSGPFSLYAWLEKEKNDQEYRQIKGLPSRKEKMQKQLGGKKLEHTKRGFNNTKQ